MQENRMPIQWLPRLASVTLALLCLHPPAHGQSSPDPAPAASGWCASHLSIPSQPTTTATFAVPPGDSRPTGPSSAPTVMRELVMSLALSGGGYRAMLFHVGTLRRLNEAGMLPRLAVVSSVSGGSVASAYLAHRWDDLAFDEQDRATNFVEVIEMPLRALARRTLDIPSVLVGLLPFTSAAERQVGRYDELLFQGALLSSIAPVAASRSTGRPRPLFIFNATSLQTGELWQFRAAAMGGPITHWTEPGQTTLSQAVAASSGFPPVLSPLALHPAFADDPDRWHDCSDFRDNPYGVAYANEPGRVVPAEARADFRRTVYLIDGGVRDNLGIAGIEEINRVRRLQGVARTTVSLISDGGATTALDPDPSTNWAGQAMRLLGLLADQPDEVRVGNIIRTGSTRLLGLGWNARPSEADCDSQAPPPELEAARQRAASSEQADAFAYWSIRRRPKFHRGYECPASRRDWMAAEVREMSTIPTAFRAMTEAQQARLINWGYLAAHHGIPYVDFAWPSEALRTKWLAPCQLPYGPEVTDPDGKAPSARDARCLRLAATGS